MNKKANKVVLIGDGSVGSSYAFAMVNQGVADELIIIDIAKEKVKADVKDLNHGAPYGMSPVTVKSGNYHDCSDADLIVITAGAAQKPGETRLDLVEKNTKIFKSIINEVMNSGFNGIFLIASNPVDILTQVTQEISGLPAERVIGSGTILDTARFKYLLSEAFNVSPTSIDASIIGEHGDSELAVWSNANISGLSLYNELYHSSEKEHLIQQIFEQTRDAAYEIIQAKGSTCYGIAMGLLHITKAILYNQNIVLTVSSKLKGEYGHNDIYIGVPTVVNRQGATKIIEIPLSNEEKALFESSVKTLQETQKSIENILKNDSK